MHTRSKRVIQNFTASILNEIAAVAASFIIPRLILNTFGSAYNGLTSSIAQILVWASLLLAGVALNVKASLYKPLALGDMVAISGIIRATERFVRKVAVIFGALLLLLASLYPFLVIDEFNWIFSFSLILILGISRFIQYFFSTPYRLLITADQKQYVLSVVSAIAITTNAVLLVIVLNMGAGIHLAYFSTMMIFALNPLFAYFYARRNYPLRRDVPPNDDAIKQRWDAFAHTVADFVHQNTDVIIITIFLGILEVSVYAIYYLVIKGIFIIFGSITRGVEPIFGDIIAKNEEGKLVNNTRVLELLTFAFATFVCSVAALQITPFVSVYTKGVTDVDYFRPIFGYIACLAVYFQCVRFPYITVTYAAGHFKQTRNGAILEVIIHLAVTVTLIGFIGITGAAVGMLVSTVYRTFQYFIYSYKNIVGRKPYFFVKRLFLSLAMFGVIVAIAAWLGLEYPTDVAGWVINSCIYSGIALAVVFAGNFAFYRDEIKIFVKSFKKK